MNTPISSYEFFIASLGFGRKPDESLIAQFKNSTGTTTTTVPKKPSNKYTKDIGSICIGTLCQAGLRIYD